MKTSSQKRRVVIGILGPKLDRGEGPHRWEHWRPTVSLCQHKNLLWDRMELIYEEKFKSTAFRVKKDIQLVSPETQVQLRTLNFQDPWNFEEVFSKLDTLAREMELDPDEEEYWVHITTGSHVQQICLFLLTESRRFPGGLVQTSPNIRSNSEEPGTYQMIDLDLSRYDKIADRFLKDQQEAVDFLKSGIATRNADFNALIDQLERVAIHSTAPILLMGPTGAGKSQLARKIYELKKSRRQRSGPFVEVNCATLRGEGSMSALFGHVKGAFTGAAQSRKGYLLSANGGTLFLDEIGELGLDEQAMLLRAIEEKVFFPVGADQETASDFQLIAGTNRDLKQEIRTGRFREDLFTRIHLWTFTLPGLKDRLEDIEPNLEYELERYSKESGSHITFNKEAREAFLQLATSVDALWSGSFRDLNAAVYRMATLSEGKRITLNLVRDEWKRLRSNWGAPTQLVEPVEKFDGKYEFQTPSSSFTSGLPDKFWNELDPFDVAQLQAVLKVCHQSKGLSEASRTLFKRSRLKKKSTNDSDRLRKYLAKFGLTWKGSDGFVWNKSS